MQSQSLNKITSSLKLLLSAMMVLSFIGCGTPSTLIKDKIFYGSQGENSDGTQADVTILHSESKITPTEISFADFMIKWNDLSDPMFAMDYAAIAEQKKEIENLCTVAPCTVEQQNLVKHFMVITKPVYKIIQSHVEKVKGSK